MADIESLITKAAKRYHISRNILHAQLNQESGLREGLTSSAGARDIAQFIPSTAKAYGVTLGDNNPADDIMGAAHMDADNLRQYGTYARMLSAYNSGKPDAYKDPSFAGGQTTDYVKTILSAAGQSGNASGGVSGTQKASGKTTVVNPGQSYQPDRGAAVQQWLLNRDRPGALLGLANALNQIPADVPETTTTTDNASGVASVKAANPADAKGGVVSDPSGKKVAGWIEPILEYARKHGWSGVVNSGYRSDAEQKAIYDRGTRPAAVPKSEGGSGSNHEGDQYPQGAIDVSQAQQLAQILQGSKYANKLQYAGAKDPVHFSHPHNGGY